MGPDAAQAAAFLAPALMFVVVAVLEVAAPLPARQRPSLGDWALNAAGLVMQGAVVPLAAVACVELVRPAAPWAGALPLGFWGAFALSFVAVDCLYYWQHRLLHGRTLWPLHLAHHASPRVDVWASSRNTLWTNFLFVYFLLNPWLALLVDRPDGFLLGVAATAALDLWRHGRVDYARLGLASAINAVGCLLTTPQAHRRHHASAYPPANFGANLIVWDRLFATYAPPAPADALSAVAAPPAIAQFLAPYRSRR